MTLADFIDANLTGLVQDWADYAQDLSHSDHQISELQLHQAGADILRAIAADMREPQSMIEQHAKSGG